MKIFSKISVSYSLTDCNNVLFDEILVMKELIIKFLS